MAATKTSSRSQTTRARACQAMATEIKRARQRESRPLPEFCALEARASTGTALREAPIELRNLGVTQGDLAETTSTPPSEGDTLSQYQQSDNHDAGVH